MPLDVERLQYQYAARMATRRWFGDSQRGLMKPNKYSSKNRMTPRTPEGTEGLKNKGSRQQRRHDARVAAWGRWRCQLTNDGRIGAGPRDDKGVMPRRVRRSIAMSIARRAGEIMAHKA
jgi:hypothetical protein